MGKNKRFHRSLESVGKAQNETERSNSDKFTQAQELINQQVKIKPNVSVSISNFSKLTSTVTPEDKDILDQLSVFATNKNQKSTPVSAIVRALIRFGWKNKEQLDFE